MFTVRRRRGKTLHFHVSLSRCIAAFCKSERLRRSIMRLSRTTRNLGLFLPLAALLLYGGFRLSAYSAQSDKSSLLVGKQSDGTYFVPTGQTLSPAGRNLPFDGRPVDLALRPDGKILAVMLSREIKFFDTVKGEF